MTFAKTLRQLRIAKGFSLQSLADKVTVTKAYIWDLETDRAKNPTLDVLKRLSTVLQVPISWLASGMLENADEGYGKAIVLFRNIQALPAEDRETVLLVLRRLINS